MRHLNLIFFFFSPNPLTISHLGGSYSFIYLSPPPPVINGSIILAVSVHPVVTPVVGNVSSLDPSAVKGQRGCWRHDAGCAGSLDAYVCECDSLRAR